MESISLSKRMGMPIEVRKLARGHEVGRVSKEWGDRMVWSKG